MRHVLVLRLLFNLLSSSLTVKLCLYNSITYTPQYGYDIEHVSLVRLWYP